MLSGINGAVAYLDDIIVMGKNLEELRERLGVFYPELKNVGLSCGLANVISSLRLSSIYVS